LTKNKADRAGMKAKNHAVKDPTRNTGVRKFSSARIFRPAKQIKCVTINF